MNTTRELSTVLAALRYWQLHLTGEAPGDDFDSIASDGGTHVPLTADEIDGLCERLNTDGCPCAGTYRVHWCIDSDASNPLDAAREAFAAMQRKGTTATYFTVTDRHGNRTAIDLEDEA